MIGPQKCLSYITRRTTICHKWARNTLLDDLSKCIWSFSQAFGHFDHFQMSCSDRTEIFSTCTQPPRDISDQVRNSNKFPRWKHENCISDLAFFVPLRQIRFGASQKVNAWCEPKFPRGRQHRCYFFFLQATRFSIPWTKSKLKETKKKRRNTFTPNSS